MLPLLFITYFLNQFYTQCTGKKGFLVAESVMEAKALMESGN